jgi:deazaflavin-dependent oxidoreductase (nitroreductase family)
MNALHESAAFDAAAPAVSPKTRVVRAIARASGPLSRAVSGRRFFPLWAIIHHTGRKSGRTYDTPIAISHRGDQFVIPIPFGEATQWVRNVTAAGGCRLTWAGSEHELVEPRVVEWDEAKPLWSPVLQAVIPVVGIRDFLVLRER